MTKSQAVGGGLQVMAGGTPQTSTLPTARLHLHLRLRLRPHLRPHLHLRPQAGRRLLRTGRRWVNHQSCFL
jgi:hypothetical protein